MTTTDKLSDLRALNAGMESRWESWRTLSTKLVSILAQNAQICRLIDGGGLVPMVGWVLLNGTEEQSYFALVALNELIHRVDGFHTLNRPHLMAEIARNLESPFEKQRAVAAEIIKTYISGTPIAMEIFRNAGIDTTIQPVAQLGTTQTNRDMAESLPTGLTLSRCQDESTDRLLDADNKASSYTGDDLYEEMKENQPQQTGPQSCQLALGVNFSLMARDLFGRSSKQHSQQSSHTPPPSVGDIPTLVSNRGEVAEKAYLSDLEQSSGSDVVFHRVCILGSDASGKHNMISSLLSGQQNHCTSGMRLHECVLSQTDDDKKVHKANCFDFNDDPKLEMLDSRFFEDLCLLRDICEPVGVKRRRCGS